MVSVLLPIRNERNFIHRSLGSVLGQDHPPERTEILVMDGMSDDGTPQIVREIIAASGRTGVRLIENPDRTQAHALNIGIEQARGEIIVRVDGHCEVAPDYLSSCVRALGETGAECVGGPIDTLGEGAGHRAISVAQSHPFGVGPVAFRTRPDHSGFVDTVPFGAYPAEVLRKLGGFDPAVAPNEDDDLNYRLRRDGGRIWMDTGIRSTYWARADLRGLFRQYFRYGTHRAQVIYKHRAIDQPRHLVPGALVVSLAIAAIASVATGRAGPIAAATGLYGGATLLASGHASRRSPRLLPRVAAAFATIHIAYGVGLVVGAFRYRATALGPR